MARGLSMAGVTDEDIIQNTHGYGCLQEFWSSLWCSKIEHSNSISTGQTKRQIELCRFGIQ